jgi:hypothetical protein
MIGADRPFHCTQRLPSSHYVRQDGCFLVLRPRVHQRGAQWSGRVRTAPEAVKVCRWPRPEIGIAYHAAGYADELVQETLVKCFQPDRLPHDDRNQNIK